MSEEKNISLLSLIQYSFLALSLGFSGFPLYVLVPDFYAVNYGISLSTLGFSLLFIRIFDAIQDPLIGIISDRYRNYVIPIFRLNETYNFKSEDAQRIEKYVSTAESCKNCLYHLKMKFGIILVMGLSGCVLALSINALFNLSFFSPLSRFIIFMTISITAYSVLTINLNSFGGLWCNQEKSQVKISSVREFFSLIGLIISVSIPHFLENIVNKDQIYEWFVLIFLSLLILGFIQFYLWHIKHSKNFDNRILSFRFIDFSSRLKGFFWIYFLSMFASSIPAVLVIFFVRDLLGAKSYTGFFLLIYFMAAAIFMQFWTYVSNKKGKYQAWLFSMLLAIFSFIWTFFLKQGDIWQYALICFISGIALGGDLIFPPSIVSDHIHKSKSQNRASSYYGILNLISKSSLAFASALSFFILDYAEFKVGSKNLSSSLTGLSIVYALIPCIIKAISAFMVWKILIKSKPVKFNRLLSKPIYNEEFLGEVKMSTAVYKDVHEERKQASTTKLPSEIEFGKKFNEDF